MAIVSVLANKPFDGDVEPFAASADGIDELHPEMAMSAARKIVKKAAFHFIGSSSFRGYAPEVLADRLGLPIKKQVAGQMYVSPFQSFSKPGAGFNHVELT